MTDTHVAPQPARWQPGPHSPQARAGVVDVWRADLSTAPCELPQLLSARERARAQRISSAHTRARWACGRATLRGLLGRYLRCEPRELGFALGPHGKPALARCAGDLADLRFNLSHSGGLVLIAVSTGHEVGVDVEQARRRGGGGARELALAARVLGAPQARRLAGLARETRARRFLQAWAMREAAVKCAGTGLAAAPPDPAAGLWTAVLELGPHACAAVAAQGEHERRLRCWEWVP
jgi:4'-phosphopantetheinyl transferase